MGEYEDIEVVSFIDCIIKYLEKELEYSKYISTDGKRSIDYKIWCSIIIFFCMSISVLLSGLGYILSKDIYMADKIALIALIPLGLSLVMYLIHKCYFFKWWYDNRKSTNTSKPQNKENI